MTTEQIKDYLKKYRIDSEEQLAKHIEELKRNTIPNNEIIFPLVDLLVNEKSVLNSYFAENKKQETITKTGAPLFLDEAVISYQSFENGVTKDNTVTYTSTRHKSQAGETHKEIVGDLEGINRLPSIYNLYDNQNYYTSKALETLNNQSAERHNIMNSDENIKKHSIHLEEKDDVITNSSRGEIEMMEYLQGVKESQSVDKAPIFTYCKVNKNALEALSLRALYGHIKYKETDSDWQNFTRVPNALEEYANASFRHALGIGEEDEETHLVAEAWNAVAKLEVFLRNKLNKS